MSTELSGPDGEPGPEAAPELPVLRTPADGVPAIVEDSAALAATVERLAGGTGPVAVDTERAHGFRYSARAYLIQLRRAGSGTALIDPVAFRQPPGEADLGVLGEAIRGAEWIVHAATQDLPCLVEVNLVPERVFDTELAARLLGDPRVALGTLIENHFGIRLLKEHSAANWSSRPLPPEWVSYAALDVELLIELREILLARLREAGKLEWAEQEFAHLVATAREPRPERVDPWRRTSGIHGVRTPRGLAIVRELWTVRDELARASDTAPGRLVPDKAIAELAQQARDEVPGRPELRQIDGFKRRGARRYENNWVDALDRVRALGPKGFPPMRGSGDALPPPRSWTGRHPEAYRRFVAARDAVAAIAQAHTVPTENLLTPEYVRRLAWSPPEPSPEAVDARLAELGARAWQRALTVQALAVALDQAPAGALDDPPEDAQG